MALGPRTRPKNDPLSGRLRRLRHRLSMSQRQMSRYFLVSRQTYINWEVHGAPLGGPSRGFVLLMIRKMQKQAFYREAKLRGQKTDQRTNHAS